MTGEKFRVPCVITISRETWKVIGIEYTEVTVAEAAAFGKRLADAYAVATECRERPARNDEEGTTCQHTAL